ncbi:MAG: RHS repeat-associated core domain-containing protein [Bacteroidales bacterium]
MQTTEGHVMVNGAGQYKYDCYLRDQLGSARARFTEGTNHQASLSGEVHYYPFGMTIAGLTVAGESSTDQLFSGKRLLNQDLSGTRPIWYDFGARYYYDAWGRRKALKQGGAGFADSEPLAWMNCGYTGHEHLLQLKLINMGGRVYDPVLGRFLHPDPHIQSPDNPLNLNRFAYCMNNPLIYTDPDGEFWHIIIGAAIGGTFNVLSNLDKIDNFGEGLASFGVGAAAGALMAGTAGASSGFLTTSGGQVLVSGIGAGSRAAVNNVIAQTGNGVGLGDVNLGSVGNDALFGLGGGMAVGALGLTYEIPTGKNSVFEFNLLKGKRILQHSVNHLLRSTAYNVGGNIATGNKPFNGFDRYFVGLDGSMLLPLAMDGFNYYASHNEQLGNKLMSKNAEDRARNVLYWDDSGETTYDVIRGELRAIGVDDRITPMGVSNSELRINYKGFLSGNGIFNYMGKGGPYPIPIERRTSNLYFGFLFTLFYK